jgi:hypothetical protein
MPAIVLGLFLLYYPLSLAMYFYFFGIFFTMAAFGDFMIIFMLLKENKNSLVLDHPSEVGCYIYREHEVQIS